MRDLPLTTVHMASSIPFNYGRGQAPHAGTIRPVTLLLAMKKLYGFLLLLGITHAHAQTPAINDDRSWNPILFLNEEFRYDPSVTAEQGYDSRNRAYIPRHSPLFTPGTWQSVYWQSVYWPLLGHGTWDGCVDFWKTPNLWTDGSGNSCLTHIVENNNDIAQFDIIPLPPNQNCNYPQGYYNCGIDWYETNNPYGYYEIKWDLPSLDRRWISWWLTSTTQEIDIAELGYGLTGERPDTLKTNVHFVTGAVNGISLPSLHSYVGVDMTAGYNTVGMEWTPKCIVIYFNGRPVNEILYNEQVPHVLMKMLMTPGVHIARGTPSLPSGDVKTKIDFIKIHTLLKGDLSPSALVTIINNSTLSSYVPMLRREIVVQGPMSSAVLTLNGGTLPGGKLTLRATDAITLQGEIEIGVNEVDRANGINGGELILFPHGDPVNN